MCGLLGRLIFQCAEHSQIVANGYVILESTRKCNESGGGTWVLSDVWFQCESTRMLLNDTRHTHGGLVNL
jgi:hypothetical protein